MTKVAYGCRTLAALQKRVVQRSRNGEFRMVTRMRPRRAEEMIGGSLHFIVKHMLVARAEILRFEDRKDGRLDIVCSDDLQTVVPTHQRAHQGWRYLEDKDAPGTEDDGSGIAALPPRLYGKLAELALL